jgi:hypothetical protein
MEWARRRRMFKGSAPFLRSATVETDLADPAGYAVPDDPLDRGRVAVVDFATGWGRGLLLHGVSCQVIQPW